VVPAAEGRGISEPKGVVNAAQKLNDSEAALRTSKTSQKLAEDENASLKQRIKEQVSVARTLAV